MSINATSPFNNHTINVFGVILLVLMATLPAMAQGSGLPGIYTWGNNQFGQLGLGNTVNQPIPTRIDGDFSDVVAVSGSLALRSNGTLLAWGRNTSGQLGNGSAGDTPALTPQPVPDLTNIIKINSNGLSSFAIKSDGTVLAWGINAGGLLGIGTTPYNDCSCTPTPTQVHNISDIVNVKAGDSHTLAIDSSSKVWAWGLNFDGELGTGSYNPGVAYEPLLITSPDLHDIIDIAAGHADLTP